MVMDLEVARRLEADNVELRQIDGMLQRLGEIADGGLAKCVEKGAGLAGVAKSFNAVTSEIESLRTRVRRIAEQPLPPGMAAMLRTDHMEDAR